MISNTMSTAHLVSLCLAVNVLTMDKIRFVVDMKIGHGIRFSCMTILYSMSVALNIGAYPT